MNRELLTLSGSSWFFYAEIPFETTLRIVFDALRNLCPLAWRCPSKRGPGFWTNRRSRTEMWQMFTISSRCVRIFLRILWILKGEIKTGRNHKLFIKKALFSHFPGPSS